MEAMSEFQDNFFDLAIVDPPYGLDVFKNMSRIRKYGQTETTSTHAPNEEYFRELFRVSQNQIIWGGNYFDLPPTRGFIFWHKHQPLTDYAAGEYAWTSFDRNAKCFDHPFYGNINAEKGRMHPHQKPVKLYKWILKNYGNGGGAKYWIHTWDPAAAALPPTTWVLTFGDTKLTVAISGARINDLISMRHN